MTTLNMDTVYFIYILTVGGHGGRCGELRRGLWVCGRNHNLGQVQASPRTRTPWPGGSPPPPAEEGEEGRFRVCYSIQT